MWIIMIILSHLERSLDAKGLRTPGVHEQMDHRR